MPVDDPLLVQLALKLLPKVHNSLHQLRQASMPLSSITHVGALRYFHEVARAGSLRKASERIHTVPSAVNRQIKLLEAELGTDLFERGRGRGGGARLTLAGELLLQRFERILTELEGARADIDAVRSIQTGRVALGVGHTMAREFIPRLIQTFGRSHPGVNFTVVAQNGPGILDMLMSDNIDAAICYNQHARPEVTHISEFSFPPVVAVSSDHPLTRLDRVRLADCAQYPLAMPEESQYSCSIQDMFARAKLNPRVILSTNSFEAILAAAEIGLAVGMTMGTHAKAYPTYANIRFLPLEEPDLEPNVLSFSVHTGRKLSPAMQAIMKLIERELASSLASSTVSPVAANADRVRIRANA